MSDFNKDEWIKRAIAARQIVPREDGVIFRYWKTEKGKRHYKPVAVQVHKKNQRRYFTLTFDGLTKSVLVNRVIGLHFLPNPENKPEVNHIDGDKGNNALANLEWATRSEQERHAHGTGLKASRGSANANSKLTAADVETIRRSPEEALAALAISLRVSMKTLKDIRSNRTWKHL